jgi:hypothetical protein
MHQQLQVSFVQKGISTAGQSSSRNASTTAGQFSSEMHQQLQVSL